MAGPQLATRQEPAPLVVTARRALGSLVRVGRPAVVVLIAAAIGYSVVTQWDGVRSALRTLSWPDVTLSLAAALAGLATSMMSWRAVLADDGHRLSPTSACRIFFVGQLGKYLPGSVWSIVMQMELGKRSGVPRGRVFTTSLAWVGLSLSSALCVGVIAFPVLASRHAGEAWVLAAALPFAVMASLPPVLNRLLNLLLRIFRKGAMPRPLSWSGVGRASGWLLATWAFFGLHLWLLADALGATGVDGLTRCIGGFALAMAAGVIFVVVPSGAGIREALIVAALAPVMSAGAALGIAVVSRGLFIVADLVSAGGAAFSATRLLRGATLDPADRPVGAR